MNGHNGLDIAPFNKLTTDRTIYAPHDGYAKLIEDVDGYGRHIELLGMPRMIDQTQHKSTLAHMEKFLVANDAFVAMGDPIGIMGRTGDADGIHLHWTYKKSIGGQSIEKNNGYKGALDIAKFVIVWPKQPLLLP